MKKLIIDRSKWRTGSGDGNYTGAGSSELLNDEGYMCCLGFYCSQLGISDNDLLGERTPASLISQKKEIHDIKGFDILIERRNHSYSNREIPYNYSTDLNYEAMFINDDGEYTAEQKEEYITELFKTKDIDVVFINDYIIKKQ